MKNRSWKKNKFIWKRRNSKWGKIYVSEIGWIRRAHPNSYWERGKSSYWWGIISLSDGYSYLAGTRNNREFPECKSVKDAIKLIESQYRSDLIEQLKREDSNIKAWAVKAKKTLNEHYGYNFIL